MDAQMWEMICTRLHKNLVADPQTLSPLHPFLSALPTTSSLLQVVCKPKKVQSGELCLHRQSTCAKGYPDFHTAAGNLVWTCYVWAPSPKKIDILLGYSLQRAATLPPLLQQKEIWLPVHHIAADSLYIKYGCVSVLLIFISCWWKTLGWSHWPLLTHMPEWRNLSFTSSSQCTCTGTYWDQLEGRRGSLVSMVHYHIGLSDKKAKKRLASGRGQGGRRTLVEPDLQRHCVSNPQASKHSAAGAGLVFLLPNGSRFVLVTDLHSVTCCRILAFNFLHGWLLCPSC